MIDPHTDDLDPDQIRVDQLWHDFWNQTDADFLAWFRNPEQDDPEGWPEFRDARLNR